MIRRIKCIIVLLTMFMIITMAIAEAASKVAKAVRVYQMERGDALELSMPKTWLHHLEQPTKEKPMMIELKNSGKKEIFYFAIMPILSNLKKTDAEIDKEIKFKLERLLKQNKDSFEGTDAEIRQLKSETVSGYYYRVTEREPADGKFKYLIQGVVRVGEMGLAFNIFTTKGQKSIEEEALAVIRSARYIGADEGDENEE